MIENQMWVSLHKSDTYTILYHKTLTRYWPLDFSKEHHLLRLIIFLDYILKVNKVTSSLLSQIHFRNYSVHNYVTKKRYIFATWNITVNNRTVNAILREYRWYIKLKRTKVRHMCERWKHLKHWPCQTPLQLQVVTSTMEKHWEQLLQHLFFVSRSLSRRWLAPPERFLPGKFVLYKWFGC